jgi:hypothetical protein
MPEPTDPPTEVRLVNGRPRAFRRHGRPYVVTRIERSRPSAADWWLVEAVGAGGQAALYDVHIDAHGAALVTPHGESSAA